MDLVTLEEVKDWAESDGFPLKSDNFVNACIKQVSKQIERHCDREFDITSRTEFYNGDNTIIRVTGFPIVSVSSLWDDPDREFDSGDELVENDDFVIMPERGIIKKRHGRFFEGIQSVKVIYSGGLSADTENMPDDLKMACIQQVLFWLRGKDKLHTAGSGVQGITTNLRTPKLTASVLQILEPFCRVGL